VACGRYTLHSLSSIKQSTYKFLPLITKLSKNWVQTDTVSETALENNQPRSSNMQDIYLFCNYCGKKTNSPCERHWNTVAQVVGYLYANWAASSFNMRSTYEYSIIIKDSFISWKTKKQKVLASHMLTKKIKPWHWPFVSSIVSKSCKVTEDSQM